MAQPPSNKSLMSILSKPEPTADQLQAAVELEHNRQLRITELYRESDRLEEEMAAMKPIDEEEYNRLVQVLPAELRDLSLAKDPKRLKTILKSIMDKQVIRTHEIEKARADKAKMEMVLSLLLREYDPDAVQAHIRSVEGVADTAKISEMEGQIKAQAEQLKVQAKQLKFQAKQFEALQDQFDAMQGQGSGVDAQAQQHE
jgi:hypothetical protein